MAKFCCIEGCTRYARCRSMCGLHYHRWYRTGDAGEASIRYGGRTGISLNRVCLVPACEEPHDSRGYCIKHYSRWKRYGDPEVRVVRRYQRAACPVIDCPNNIDYNGYCRKHAERVRANGDPNIIKNPGPGSGRSLRKYGKKENPYIAVWAPDHPNVRKDGYVAEHIKVLTDHLGRPLYLGENVHHKNGVRSDNKLSNLELWVTSQPSGQRPEDLVTWALEIIERYGDYRGTIDDE